MSDNHSVVPDDMRADFNMLSDEAKAGVLRAQIEEHEKTERDRIEQQEQTRRNLHDKDGYHVVRALFVIFLLCVVGGLTCVGTKRIELEDLRIRDLAAKNAPHPPAPPPPPPPPPVPVILVQPDGGR